jgi:Mg-chelatase subunit ChlD
VRKHGKLVCPVCNSTWKDVPLLAIHKTLGSQSPDQNDVATNNHDTKPKIEAKKIIDSSPRALQPNTETQLIRTPKPFSDSRSYDDDEPLLSPTAGSRITPIPEADENAEADDVDDEFQGFFVNNPNPPSSSIKYSDPEEAPPSSGRDHSRNVRVRLLPESALVSAGRSHETHVVALRVKAPPARNTAASAPLDRAPIDLVTVLDVSGSMTGAKLHMLKRAMRLVISSLGSTDRLSIVAFSATSKRMLPLRRMTAQGQRAARRIVDRLVCNEGTSVGDALRKASKVLEDRRERNPVASIMLLSDGQDHDARRRVHHANNQRQASSHVSSTRFAHIEIPVHKFGFGDNEKEPAEDSFAKCVGGLLSVVVQDLRIQLGFPSPAEISGIYSCNGRPTVLGSGSVRLGDMYAEEEREILVELRVPTSATVGTHHVMSFRCLYKDPATQEVVYGKEQALLVPRPPPTGFRSSTTPARTDRLRNLFITARAIAESRRLIEHEELSSAHQLLASARALLLQSSLESVEEYVRSLEAELAELQWRRQQQQQQMMAMVLQRRRGRERDAMGANMEDENGEPLTPTSAWRAAEKLAKVAMLKKSLNRVSDLHGFENARF